MSRQESYEFDKKYEYRDESPYEGAVDEGIEDAKFLYGEVSWSAEIKWNKSAKHYEAELFWTDHGNNFSDFGEGPMRDEFLDDLYTFISNKGIGYEEFELVWERYWAVSSNSGRLLARVGGSYTSIQILRTDCVPPVPRYWIQQLHWTALIKTCQDSVGLLKCPIARLYVELGQRW